MEIDKRLRHHKDCSPYAICLIIEKNALQSEAQTNRSMRHNEIFGKENTKRMMVGSIHKYLEGKPLKLLLLEPQYQWSKLLLVCERFLLPPWESGWLQHQVEGW